jgi:hypothetical protein
MSVDSWPDKPWDLTAPEFYALSYLRDGNPVDAFQYAVAELLLRDALATTFVEPPAGRPLRKRKVLLVDGEAVEEAAPPALEPALGFYRRTEKSESVVRTHAGASEQQVTGIPIGDFVKAAKRRFTRFFDRPMGRYLDRHLVPLLVEAGLVSRSRSFGRRRLARTSAGEQRKRELEAWVWSGDDHLAEWISSEPALALKYAAQAGAGVLFVRDAYSVLGDLSDIAREVVTPAALGPGIPHFDRVALEMVDYELERLRVEGANP